MIAFLYGLLVGYALGYIVSGIVSELDDREKKRNDLD
jgi:hypothetical protein